MNEGQTGSGSSSTHCWAIRVSLMNDWHGYYVVGLAQFTSSGWAVMDDFGTLVQVAR